ncbi:hypothetical protein AK830_g12146 [Neonectria ditissima]|uniref:Uncharacterized protein n=1 Tax=Neonectria ditissima TaxID=78410 RepID=A0A0P7B641_9HYPO|nr:hypothetical protein AK830_g12146 [Neonectria ditissima]
MINEPEDKEIKDQFAKETLEKKPGTSGACFSWELKPGQAIPDVNIYVPLCQYFKSDKAIVEVIEKIFRNGNDVCNDEIKTPTVHTFISFHFSEKKGAYVTTYVAPFVRFL